MDCKNARGFTLVELLVSVSIAAVLLIVVIPSLFDLMRANQLTVQVNRFVSIANLARSEAINRNLTVVLCVRSANSCDTGNNWEQGWIVFVDNDADLQVDSGETIRIIAPLPQGYTFKPNVSVNSLIYLGDGRVRRSTGALPLMTFRLCAPDAQDGSLTARSRELVINATGRMRLQFGREIAGAC